MPPTEERVVECLQAAGLAATDIVGVELIRQRPITAEKVTINAVIAGCLSAYMSVVVAILRAMCQEPFNLHGSMASAGVVRHLLLWTRWCTVHGRRSRQQARRLVACPACLSCGRGALRTSVPCLASWRGGRRHRSAAGCPEASRWARPLTPAPWECSMFDFF